jgi:uncharacterized protein (DUF2252 family)
MSEQGANEQVEHLQGAGGPAAGGAVAAGPPAARSEAALTRAERVAAGKAARTKVALTALAQALGDGERADPVALLQTQAESRVAELVPIRYGRMLTSEFAFYRGAAMVMAADLAATPTAGLRVQLCGDAHMSNFGVFASPERQLVFDANDFDETAPGPFEWDVKRLAASLEVAARGNGFKTKERRAIVAAAAASYREAMRTFATQTNLAVWYAHLNTDKVMAEYGPQLLPRGRRLTEAALAKARTRDSMHAFTRLVTTVDGRPRITPDPPLIVPIEDLLARADADEIYATLRTMLRSYRRTLTSDRRVLLEQYQLLQLARKVVGVGSVGTRAWILLMQGIDGGDPMFLQAKEAQASVLEAHAGKSRHSNHGQRVVHGQRLMQATSDIFLGWHRVTGADGVTRDYYIRQLRDQKGSAIVENMRPPGMTVYARLCGWTLARAHARSGDRVAIAAYLGGKPTFDNAIADYAVSYADQTTQDYGALRAAADSGRILVLAGL